MIRSTLAALALLAAPTAAQEVLRHPDGLEVTLEGARFVDWGDGRPYAEVRMALAANPEPFGPRPPQDVIPWHKTFCEMVQASLAEGMAERGIAHVAMRWDFAVDAPEGSFVTSRFHDNLFRVEADGTCAAVNAHGAQAPNVGGALAPVWLRAESVRRPGLDGMGVVLSYALDALGEAQAPARRAAAEALCEEAWTELTRREEAYANLDYAWLGVTFEHRPRPGFTEADGHVWVLGAPDASPCPA